MEVTDVTGSHCRCSGYANTGTWSYRLLSCITNSPRECWLWKVWVQFKFHWQ